MSEPRHHPEPAGRDPLATCMREVDLARRELRAGRQVGARGPDVQRLRSALLTALQGYAAEITRLGAPVPHRLQSEIDMLRRLDHRS